jgi:hypothetical protein
MPSSSSTTPARRSLVAARSLPIALILGLASGVASCEGPGGPATGAPETVRQSHLAQQGKPRADRPGCFPVLDKQPPIDPRRSLAVTDVSILSRFSFERVMKHLAGQTAGQTALGLFQQWWDTQNPGPGLGRGAHCDDERDATGAPSRNGFPYGCRAAPAEGGEAAIDPFRDFATNPNAYVPIGLFNRFDLAPADGRHCGEHRIVFARRSGTTIPQSPPPPASLVLNERRNLVIFEAAVPNPNPAKGLTGCFPVAAAWAALSFMPDPGARAAWLEKFYFTGLTSVDESRRKVTLAPVLAIDNFGAAGRGQIRTNQFMVEGTTLPKAWALREFQIQRVCRTTGCSHEFVPVTVKANPYGGLFDPLAVDPLSASYHPRAAAFQAWFPTALAGLLGNAVTALSFDTGDAFNTAQSLASGSNENRYAVQLGPLTGPFRAAIVGALAAAGSGLTPEEVVLRAQTQSCAGCHQLNNVFDPVTRVNGPGAIGGGLTWPASLRFVHVSEQAPEQAGTAGERFRISPALAEVFLPHRARVLTDYLNGTVGCAKDLKKQPSLGGSKTH